jgi:MFS family permease
MADWSAVFMKDVVKTSTYFEGWGMAGYSLFMALGRLVGDKIIPRFGANKILFYGGILSIIGILIVIVLPYTFSAIIGFALVGAGVSCGAPILYASASRVPNMAKGSGLAIMNTFAMGGFLFGPVLIGFISKATTLSIAFGFIASLGLVWVIQSKRVKLF